MIRVIFHFSSQSGEMDGLRLIKIPKLSNLDHLNLITESIKRSLTKGFFKGHYEAELKPCYGKDEHFDFDVFTHYEVARIRTCGVKRWRYI